MIKPRYLRFLPAACCRSSPSRTASLDADYKPNILVVTGEMTSVSRTISAYTMGVMGYSHTQH